MGAPASSDWPEYLVERASGRPPGDCCIVPGSTPVVSFGHPLRPKVATLGINPSSREFLAGGASLLSGPKRRLATLESLGLASYDEMTPQTARCVIDDCASYFERQPYGWFKPLDTILSGALGSRITTGQPAISISFNGPPIR